MSENNPIFIRGYSRSGGTLMVTILDAHPEIAMSYELYPNLLAPENGELIDIDRLIEVIKGARHLKSASKKVQQKNIGTFLARCIRGGLNNEDVVMFLKEHRADGLDFSDIKGRMKFIEKCCVTKMRNEGKSRWGLKCSNQYDDYLNMWPGAYFLNIIRDGRDVLASQLTTGSFNKTPAEVARGWVRTHLGFRKLIERSNVNALEVYYEKLVTQPETEIRKICNFLNVPFDKSMLNFYEQELTIYAKKTGHLSADRISKPIDSSKVGRWKKDLNKKQLEEFYSVAKDTMIGFGYLGHDECFQTLKS